MGSGASKLDTNGVTLPARFRPVFLQRLEELTARRRNRPLKDSTPSKKELLLHDNDNASQHHHDGSINHCKKPEESKPKEKACDKEKGVATIIDTKHDVVKVESLKAKGKDERKENVVHDDKAKVEDVFKDFDHDDEDDDDDDDERMIGHEDDEAFPGSPSFRVFFNDNREDDHNEDIGNSDGLKTKAPSNDAVSTKDPSVREQVKRGKKRRSFKHVFPKGGQEAVKNLLNVTACYTPSHSPPERNRLLADKANT